MQINFVGIMLFSMRYSSRYGGITSRNDTQMKTPWLSLSTLDLSSKLIYCLDILLFIRSWNVRNLILNYEWVFNGVLVFGKSTSMVSNTSMSVRSESFLLHFSSAGNEHALWESINVWGKGLPVFLKGFIPAYFLCFRLESTE